MGIFDELQKNLGGAAAGGQPGGGQGALLQTILGLLQGGGLQQLVASFQQKGSETSSAPGCPPARTSRFRPIR